MRAGVPILKISGSNACALNIILCVQWTSLPLNIVNYS